MFRQFTISFGGETYKSGPFDDDEYVHESLIRRHLFPAVRSDFDEIPPVFSSDSLSVALSKEAYDLLPSRRSRKSPINERHEAFSPMSHTFLKFDGNVRSIQIPHPVPFMRLAREISENWQSIKGKMESHNSRIMPKPHPDGRLITMEYQDKANQAIDEATSLVGSRYVVHTDISNCFPSLYTHAIDWALRGRPEAKADRSKANWEARIDMRVSDLQDGETNGVGIGPGTSNLMAEIVLQTIDKKLSGYRYTRYIDDYTCYAESRQQAEQFIYDLNDELYNFRLTLNHRKTEIVDVGISRLDPWLHEARQLAIDPNDSDLIMIRKLRDYQELARRYPDASVLIFGIKALSSAVKQINPKTLNRILPELARMIWVYPFLTAKVVQDILPTIERESDGASVLLSSLEKVLGEAGRRKQADVVMWSLYGLSLHETEPTETDVFSCLSWNPACLAAGHALTPGKYIDQILGVLGSLNKDSRQLTEEYWLLRYQMWLRGELQKSELNEDGEVKYFSLLRKFDVDFYKVPESWSE